MSEACPYCGQEYAGPTYLYTHVLSQHSEAVRSHWVEVHDLRPGQSGQQSLAEVVA